MIDKTWAAGAGCIKLLTNSDPDLYLICKLKSKASVCISDKDWMRMFYLAYQVHTSK